MNVVPVTLEIPDGKVRLEPLQLAHAADLFEAGADDPRVWRYLAAWPHSIEEMQGVIAGALELKHAGRELPFAVVETARGRAIGSTRYEEILPRHRSLEIGWTWYGVPWQGTACNAQCKFMLLRHAFESLGAVRVQLKADTRNERSRRAIERIGAVFEGVLRKHRILPDGYVRDSACYSVIAEEWPAVKARIKRLMAGS
jgi:RimJ/RimL family protein N-acetyltransferase